MVLACPNVGGISQYTTESGHVSHKRALGPRIQIDHPTEDLGEVKPNTQYTCRFSFKNVGAAPLTIKTVLSTCSCSTAKLEKNEYAPGESGTVIVQFKSLPVEGSVIKYLHVLSDDPETPRSLLTIKAAVAVPWDVVPENIKLDLRKRDSGVVPITIRSKDGRAFRITSVASPNNVITGGFDPNCLATEQVLRAKVDVEAVRKNDSGRIVIETTHPEFRFLTVPYTTEPEFEIFPQRIVFFGVGAQEQNVRYVTIRHNYGEDFKLASVKSLNGHMKVLNTEQNGPNAKLAVACQLPVQALTAGYLNDELEIRCDKGQIYRIPCSIWLTDRHQ
jgi:hypothetical protein